MESWIIYAPSIFFAIVGGGWLLFCRWYIRLRKRWHKKGIMDFSYDGWEDRHNLSAKTLLDGFREERKYDRK